MKTFSLLVLLMVLSCQVIGLAEVVDIPDPNLRKALVETLQINAGEKITKEALAGLEYLYASNKSITNLNELKNCTRLTRLNLSYNKISDVSPLANLNSLTNLNLNGNQISDVSPLAKLTNLTHFDLAGNRIHGVNSLANLTDLTNLNLNGNQISDVSPLANLNSLTSLGLFHNQISDVSPLAKLTNLIELTLWRNKISNVNPLANLTNLKVLSVSNNQLTDVSGLANLTNLIELNLNYNLITNLNGLANANLPKLEDLSLIGNQLNDLKGLARIIQQPELTYLRLWNNLITDLSPLANVDLSNLAWLDLNNNQISDISPIVGNKGISGTIKLNLNNNQISDISPIVENGRISGTIKLKNNPLNNTSLTSHISALIERGVKVECDEIPVDIIKISDSAFEASLREKLNLYPKVIISKSNTAGLINLNMANTETVNIDVEALKALPELKVINLAGNPLSREAVVTQIPALETSGIKVNLGASEANLVELSVDKSEIAASQAATKTLTITVKDASDRLVKREVITLAVNKGNIQKVADNQGDGTYTAVYTAIDTVGEAEVIAVTENGAIGTIKLKLVETVVSAKKSTFTVSHGASPKTGESIMVVVQLLNEEKIALSGKEITLKVSPAEEIKIESEVGKTDKEGKAEFKFIANSKGLKKITAVSGEIELDQTRAVTVKESQLADANGDGTVNIFDLIMVAEQFGKSGTGLSGDVNGDGTVNIFDLIMAAGNFGKSNEVAAPTLLVNKLTFTNQQKRRIQSTIVELEGIPVRSEAEELALNLLIVILPDRLLEYTQLLSNYPNPFNPETWIPYHLSQDAEVVVRIYDVRGRIVRTLDMGFQIFGYYTSRNKAAYWNGKADTGEMVSSGTYFYQIQTGDYTETRKMVILK